MDCPHIERTAISPGNGKPINRCGLVGSEAGQRHIWIPVSRCEGECSQKDDGTSHASKAIVYLLKRRVAVDWEKEPCVGCGGSSLTIEEALTCLKIRIGAEDTGKSLVQAVENGMPAQQAEQLAKDVLPEMIA